MAKGIRYWREQRGLSQRELGERVSRHWTTIAKWEKGERAPKPDEIRRVAAALEVHPLDISEGPAVPLSPDELALVDAYRGMSEPQRELVRDMVEAARHRRTAAE